MHGNGNSKDAFIDALIAGGSAALGALVMAYGVSGGIPSVQIVYGAFLALGVAFLASLAAARRRGHPLPAPSAPEP